MSYDVSFKVKVEGTDKWVCVGDCNANITWNLGEMIRESTKLEWKNEADNGLCIQVIPSIVCGLSNLIEFSEKYKQYESPNGWGTLQGCINFFRRITDAWMDFAQENPQVAKVAHFWIE